MRKTCLNLIYELARKNEKIFFVGSDLGPNTLRTFKEEMPQRFFMEGINEGHALGMAAGLAMAGKIVYFNTIASFITRRAYEQIIVDLCMHRANVRLIGNGGGLVYAPLGSTHLAIEDIASLRAIPNMTIVAPADAAEMTQLMPQTVDYEGPIYIRLAKGGDPIVTPTDTKFVIGRGRSIQAGNDALLVTTGIGLQIALAASRRLEAQGIATAICHLPTIKPLDKKLLRDMAAPVRGVITIEEHMRIGGLGSAVAEVVLESNFPSAKRFKRIGIPDVFPDLYGSQKSIMKTYGISVEGVTETVQMLMAD